MERRAPIAALFSIWADQYQQGNVRTIANIVNPVSTELLRRRPAYCIGLWREGSAWGVGDTCRHTASAIRCFSLRFHTDLLYDPVAVAGP
jgi:hypothetical protein